MVSTPSVAVEPLAAGRRAECTAIVLHPDQRRFVAPVGDYLALCTQSASPWQPVALVADGHVIGFAMWGVDNTEGSHWIGGFQIERRHQRRGLGRDGMRALIAHLTTMPGCREIALSYHAENVAARRLYESLGFRESGEVTEDGEVVARLSVAAFSGRVDGT